jgi:hypothetical protein
VRQLNAAGSPMPSARPAPAARGPSGPRPPACGWGCAWHGGAPGTSAGGPFTGMATRSLRGRGAGAPGHNYQMAEVGGVALP